MANIGNIFKNLVYFQSISECDGLFNIDYHWIHKNFLYETMLIQDIQSIRFGNVDDIYRKVEPFLHYLASEHIAMEPEGSRYSSSEFYISICNKTMKNIKSHSQC